MSNNMNTPPTIRWQLLATVSTIALLASVYATGAADAAGNDADRPLIWIELGGQMENVSGQGDTFAPAFIAANSNSPVLGATTPLQAQKPPAFSFGEEGKISFQPEGSDWIYAASLRYGRSSNFRHVHHQTYGVHYAKYKYGAIAPSTQTTAENFADTIAHHRESHAILDFSAGKDVGLGMFGRDSSSTLSLGIRFAQFTSSGTFDIRVRPDLKMHHHEITAFHLTINKPYFHSFYATGQASRDFHGIGPSLSWSGSTPFVGDPRDGEITLDWGANAALLFGRQKTRVQHQESARYKSYNARYYTTVYPAIPHGHNNVRSVTVPNVGGFAGISWRVEDFKVSLGYRADFFLQAMDTGIDARKSETRSFCGPFASISVGLGD